MQQLWRSMESQLPVQQQSLARHSVHPNLHNNNTARISPPLDPEMGKGHYEIRPELSVAAMQPPRLQQTNVCSRLLLTGVCCMCMLIVVSAWVAFFSLPVIVDTRTTLQQRMTPALAQTRRPLPAVLRRYGMIKRAQAPAKGADAATLRAAFPGWHAMNGTLHIDAVVSDMALGLAAVVEQLDPVHEPRIITAFPRPPSPPPPPELYVPSSNSEEEIEL